MGDLTMLKHCWAILAQARKNVYIYCYLKKHTFWEADNSSKCRRLSMPREYTIIYKVHPLIIGLPVIQFKE